MNTRNKRHEGEDNTVMTMEENSQDHTIIHLPPGDADWAGVITQFVLYLSMTEGRAFAAGSAERLLRASKNCEGIIALADGKLQGITLVEVVKETAEISLPWTPDGETAVAQELVLAAVQIIHTDFPQVCYIRSERALLPGATDTSGLLAAGFQCHWRLRMQLELSYWQDTPQLPTGYIIAPWKMRYLDEAAQMVFLANAGTLDAELYAPFFGNSTWQCRHGLLAILAGNYGPLIPQATVIILHDQRMAGINLVIKNDSEQACILEISVHPSEQGKGLGRALMAHSLTALQHKHYARVELAVTRANTRALSLYESLGFQTIGEFPVCVWPG